MTPATATNYRAKALDKFTNPRPAPAQEDIDGLMTQLATNKNNPTPVMGGDEVQLRNSANVRYIDEAGGSGIPTTAQPAPMIAQPYTGGREDTVSFDVNAAYDDVLKTTKAASDASFQNTQQQILGQQAGIGQKYDAMNKQAYSNARLSAMGNNEAMAAQGLAGNAYAGPQSGYSETSRVAQDAALGNAINSNELARRNALDELTGQVNQARMSNDAALLGQEANIYGQKASALQEQDQFNQNMALQNKQFALDEAGVTGTYNDKQTLAAKNQADQLALSQGGLTGKYTYTDPATNKPITVNTLAQNQYTSDLKQKDIENAMAELESLGWADDKIAQVLGLTTGTTTLGGYSKFKKRIVKKV